jgi:LPXTG-motif cell wall-anchored protein
MTARARIFRWLGAGALAGAAFLVSAPIAGAAGSTFTVNTTTVKRGESITLTSSTPCTLPSGVTGTPLVRVTLARGSTVLARATGTTQSGGTWRATLVVPASIGNGSARVDAVCVASEQAEGALVDYDDVAVDITDDLPHTGSSSLPLAFGGGALALTGAALLTASGRRVRRIA